MFKQRRLPHFTSTSQPLETGRLSKIDALYTPMFVTNPSLQLIERVGFKKRNGEKEGGRVGQYHNATIACC